VKVASDAASDSMSVNPRLRSMSSMSD
jgi:hypothetical protein